MGSVPQVRDSGGRLDQYRGTECPCSLPLRPIIPACSVLTTRRWFALVRTWTPWLAPRHGRSSFELDKDALLCSFLSAQGKHLVFLGMSGVDNVMTLFRSSGSERLTLHVCCSTVPWRLLANQC